MKGEKRREREREGMREMEMRMPRVCVPRGPSLSLSLHRQSPSDSQTQLSVLCVWLGMHVQSAEPLSCLLTAMASLSSSSINCEGNNLSLFSLMSAPVLRAFVSVYDRPFMNVSPRRVLRSLWPVSWRETNEQSGLRSARPGISFDPKPG